MDEKIKQRVLGAAVLLILVLMVLPFFRHSHETQPPQINVEPLTHVNPAVTSPTPNTAATTLASTSPTDTTTITTTPAPTTSISPESISKKITEPKQETLSSKKTMTETTATALKPIDQRVDPIASSSTASSIKQTKTTSTTTAAVTSTSKTTAPKEKTATIAKNTPTKVNIKTANEPIWTVQVGTYRQFKLADKLVKELESAGKVAYQTTLHHPQEKLLYRVRVGKKLKHAEAQTLAAELEKSKHLKAIVVHENS